MKDAVLKEGILLKIHLQLSQEETTDLVAQKVEHPLVYKLILVVGSNPTEFREF